ncbi:unnamed protein product [Adineta ricciae]|uniref:DED domain-containing protein n=1 Tax=Adineta ricciae TaxID=249248 RepID=A0A814FKB8_ADIRI|nr:unnamed protein product [Adineta ricciae]
MEFRSILIDISNQLSDANRHAFHFALGKVIPRKCRDDCTPDGTLRLLDCLFERGFIANENFDNLIHIFEQIQCFDIVEQLNEYRSRLIRTSIAEPVSPSCTDDVIQTYSHSMSVNVSPSSEELAAELECANIQSRTITLPEETYTVNERKRKKRFSIVRSILYSKSNLLYMKLIMIFLLSMILLLLSFNTMKQLLRKSNFEEQSLLHQHEFVYTMKEGSPYATGKQHNDQIVMLQFHWIKRTSSKEKIITEVRNLREICEFIFVSNRSTDRTIVHAQGIESSWYDLKRKLHREGDAYDMAASYYQKTRQKDRGPELFAIINNDTVFYHHNNQWITYNSARNVSCSIRPWSD